MKKLILVCALLAGLLLPIGRLSAQIIHNNTISWSASTTTGATYNVYRAPLSCTGTFAKLNTSPITVLTFTDSGLADGAVNCYYVTAVSPAGIESTPSGKVLATTPVDTAAPPMTAPPGAPTSSSQ